MKNLTIRTKLIITIGTAVGAAAAVVLLLLSQLGTPSQAYTDLLTGEVHQIDVLHVGPRAQVRDEAAEHGGFELFAVAFVHGVVSG